METLDEIKIEDTQRVGFGTRLGALFLDLVMALFVGGILGYVLNGFFTEFMIKSGIIEIKSSSLDWSKERQYAFANALSGIVMMYWVYMALEGVTGRTPAKMILGLQNANEDGSAAPISTLITRAVLKYISTITSLVAAIIGIEIIDSVGGILGFAIFIGCFFVLGKKRQSFHDMIAKTAVYNKEDVK